jgi:hypothetical protein
VSESGILARLFRSIGLLKPLTFCGSDSRKQVFKDMAKNNFPESSPQNEIIKTFFTDVI